LKEEYERASTVDHQVVAHSSWVNRRGLAQQIKCLQRGLHNEDLNQMHRLH